MLQAVGCGPTADVLLLAGIVRGLWGTDPEVDVRDLDVYLPDQWVSRQIHSVSTWLYFQRSRGIPSDPVQQSLLRLIAFYGSFAFAFGTGGGHGVSLCLRDFRPL